MCDVQFKKKTTANKSHLLNTFWNSLYGLGLWDLDNTEILNFSSAWGKVSNIIGG
jgi:hypothetical protein